MPCGKEFAMNSRPAYGLARESAEAFFPSLGDFGQHDIFLSFKSVFDEVSNL